MYVAADSVVRPQALALAGLFPRPVSAQRYQCARVMSARQSNDPVVARLQPFNAQPLLEIQNLVVSFNSSALFSSVSLELAESEILFVKGPSGIGKSRFVRAIAHLDRSWTGEVRLGGLTADKVGFPHWRRRVCYVSDAPPPLTASAEVIFEGVLEYSTRQRNSPGVVSSVNTLRDVATRLGVSQEVLQRSFTLLSAGERQRVALSWAIALRPEVSIAYTWC